MARIEGMKKSIQSHYSILPDRFRKNYNHQVASMQKKAAKIVNSWKELEKEFLELKRKKIDNKFQLAILNQKRKLYRKEFAAVMNGLTLVMVSIKSGNYTL